MFRLNEGRIPCFLQVASDFNRTMFRLERIKIETKGGPTERHRRRRRQRQPRGRKPGGAKRQGPPLQRQKRRPDRSRISLTSRETLCYLYCGSQRHISALEWRPRPIGLK